MIKKILVAMLALFAAVAFAAVDVNTATQMQLEGVSGIGPIIAGNILLERQKGNYKDWNDMIKRAKGVGDKNAVTFSAAGLTVNGAPFTGAAAKAAAPKKAGAPKATASMAKAPMVKTAASAAK